MEFRKVVNIGFGQKEFGKPASQDQENNNSARPNIATAKFAGLTAGNSAINRLPTNLMGPARDTFIQSHMNRVHVNMEAENIFARAAQKSFPNRLNSAFKNMTKFSFGSFASSNNIFDRMKSVVGDMSQRLTKQG